MSDSRSSTDRLTSPARDASSDADEDVPPTSDIIAETAPAFGLPPSIDRVKAYSPEFPWQTLLAAPQREGSLGRVGHYEILEVVGQGGMGCVLRAFDDQLHRIVAVKLMLAKLISSENAGLRFIREARAAACINHPNVVTVHAADEYQGMPYLVMEFVEGRTLQQRIQDAPLELLDVLRITEQICNGLSAAHKRGIVHRDIKPGNIILEDGVERVKITDFGLARLVVEHSDLTSLGDMVGTPAFMSPEQVGGGEIDIRSDLFSLGSVIYAMIAGQSPFRRNTTIGSATAVKHEPHVPLRDVAPECPAFLAEIVDRLLQKDPRDRIQTADEVAEQLRRHIADLHQHTIGFRRSVAPPARRSRWWWALLTLPLLAAAVLLRPGPSPQPLLQPLPPGDGTQASALPSGGGATAAPVSTAQGPREPRSWTVATSGPADFTDLQAALDAAGPGDRIQVLDTAEYQGPFVIDDSERLAGVHLNAVQSATLTGPPSLPVLTLKGTPGVQVQGFRIHCGPEHPGLLVQGKVPGGKFEDVKFEQVEESTVPAILLTDGCGGDAGEEILIIRLCRFRSVVGSIELRSTGTAPQDAIAHVLMDGNYLTGPATHLKLTGTVRNVMFDYNVLFGGRGVEVDLAGGGSGELSISQNTFFRMDSWLQFIDASRDYSGVARNNLILETPDASPLANLTDWQTPWEMHHNVWERSTPLDAAIPDGHFIVVADAGVPERVPDTGPFLKPSSEGFAATGSSTASYLGAMAPVPGPGPP